MGDPLRSADDDGSREGKCLRERQWNVSGSRRKVHDEVVELTPLCLQKQLLKGFVRHRPAPDHGFLGIDKFTDGHGLDAVHIERDQHVAFGHRLEIIEAEHGAQRGTVDVSVEESAAGPGSRETERKQGRNRRLPNTAFTRPDRNDMRDAREHWPVCSGRCCGELDVDGPWFGAGSLDGRHCTGHDVIFRGGGGCCQLDDDLNGTAIDFGRPNHSKRDEISLQIGVHDLRECVQDGCFCHWHSSTPVEEGDGKEGRVVRWYRDPWEVWRGPQHTHREYVI